MLTNQAMPYLVGNKIYGGGRSNPTSGPVDKLGYIERDSKTKLRRNALLRQMRLNLKGNHASPYAGRKI